MDLQQPHRQVRAHPGAVSGALLVLAASVLWGTTGTAATFAPDAGPLAIGAVAMGVGGLLQALTALRPMGRARLQLQGKWKLVLLGAMAVAVYPLAFYSSMHLAGVAVGTVVSIGSAPLASALIERAFDRHRLSMRWGGAALLGLSGTALLCFAAARSGGHSAAGAGDPGGGGTLAGIGLGLVAGLTYALYSWAAHRIIGGGVPARAAMGAMFGVGGLLLMPVLLATGAPLLASWSNAAVGGYMALVPMFAGYVLFGLGLARVRASTATTLSLAEPVVAAVLAVLVVGERLPLQGWSGILLVIASLAVLTMPGRRRRVTAGGRVPVAAPGGGEPGGCS
ncbi:DMT family transporter [Arthrobacter sp. CAU 1506]|uniref:DMT family transporter n=1 Tax=Arthrobacter sp. CAU 1506 TaxID=2560052 RepID=UPI00197A8E53|nr:DMT family transporter [Arthrobacter sp. CAU 1506]